LDGIEIELPDLECVVVVNLPSCYGGAYLWDENEKPMRIGDGIFEVVGITGGFHLVCIQYYFVLKNKGQCQTGAKPLILGRGSDIKIQFADDLIPIQVDGEPWEQPPCKMHITYHTGLICCIMRKCVMKS